MKTPEEIKKGLECCQSGCYGCPYENFTDDNKEDCQYVMLADALAYIRRMEDVIDYCCEIATTINIEGLNALTKVIRCENCAHLTRSPWGHPKLGWCKLSGHHRKLDYYCASAKQKEG